jgi:RNA polymerase sigma factor (sigma-70 family)
MLPWRRETALRSSAVRGDRAAFTALYERHHQGLYRYCRSILRQDADARDALQNTMAKAFAALEREERDFELRPWLFRIAHNESISIIRRREATAELDPTWTLGPDTVVHQVEDRERLGHLYADLADLPERQRAALVLRELSQSCRWNGRALRHRSRPCRPWSLPGAHGRDPASLSAPLIPALRGARFSHGSAVTIPGGQAAGTRPTHGGASRWLSGNRQRRRRSPRDSRTTNEPR